MSRALVIALLFGVGCGSSSTATPSPATPAVAPPPAATPLAAPPPPPASFHERAMAGFRTFTDKMCACTTVQDPMTCAKGVTAEMQKWAADNADEARRNQPTDKPTDEELEVARRLARCTVAATTAGTGSGAGTSAP